ncbi:hypothetical protein HDU87_002735 [Geranomyces variabilis]|uniref:FAS1 domain-containing protein n=1 Tax=Geranomyces variabilis TaxID=109894 RepID=A0AAD5TRI6_9FUNG|nr:hypothetical protein HDU87_002735 [Geranomyces variabilis]
MRISLFALFAATATAGSAFAQVLHLPTNTIWENLVAYDQSVDSGNNTYHMSIVNEHAAPLKELLSGPGPFTVFFPSDHSFNSIQGSDPAYYQQLTTDNSLMLATLEYFITDGTYDIFTNPPAARLPSILKPSTLLAQIVPNGPDAPAGWVACSVTATGDPTEVYVVHTMPSSNGILYVTGFSHVLHAPPEAIAAAAAAGGVIPHVTVAASSAAPSSTIASSTRASSSSSSSSVAISTSTSIVSTTPALSTFTAVPTTATIASSSSSAASTATAAAGNASSGASASAVVANTLTLGGVVAAAAVFSLWAM